MDEIVFRPFHTVACMTRCSTCNMREICLPVGLNREEMSYVDGHMVVGQRKVARGETLIHAGDRFDALFVVWTGFFKSLITSRQGKEQVTGFQTSGELIGLGGIDTGRHEVDVVALEDSQVCVIPYAQLEAVALEVPSLQREFHRHMSHEIATDHEAMLQLGSMHAEERVAAFLLNLVHRLEVRGFSSSSVLLRMSREEIGSFLGLKLETVSRTLSKFQADGLLFVRQRQIQITEPLGLQQVLDPAAS
ncbi:MAG: cyclic nucleotide-binding domain-containing protein [Caldimonas sp.]